MNFFLTDILTADENSFSLVLEINDLEGQKICECLIARIQDNLVYSEFNIKIENNLAYFNWHEQGAKIDRELVLYNCCMPWDEPYTFPINDEVCDYYLDISILENSMYAAKLRYIDDFDFFDSEIDIPYISDIKLFKAGTKYKELSKLKSLLTAIFKNVFTNEKLDNIEKMINNLEPEICKENIEVICISYLYFIKNTRKNDTYKQLIKVFNKIIYLYSENKPLILKTLLNMNISEKDFKRLSLVFSLFSLKPDNKTTFSPVERNLLWNFLPELAFILDIQTKQDPGRICNWVSDNVISQMLNIKPECSIRSCLQKNINAECKCDKVSFNLSKDIFGSTKHINGFFEFLNKDFSSARRLNKYTNVELLKKYEQQAENTEVRIMGKSYFSTVQDWKTSTDKKKCEKFNSILEKVIKKSDVIKVVENNYPLVIKTLRERYDTTPSIEYYIGIFIFINCLSRRDLLKLSTNEERIISHIYKRFRALFVRDLIAFELYLLYGGMNYGS
jgi:hypothetical protein